MEMPLSSRKHIYIIIGVFVFVSIGSFLLGYWYGRGEQEIAPREKIENSIAMTSIPDFVVPDANVLLDEEVVASSRGTKYYFPWCSGAKNLKMETRVTFSSAKEAEAKGYTRSKTCDTGSL